jgi:protein-disulfide isomerase
MRIRYTLALSGLAAIGVFSIGFKAGRDWSVPIPAPAETAAMTRAEFDQRAADFIRTHGEQLDQSIGQYHADQARLKQDQGRQTIRDHHRDIYDDAEMPSVGNSTGDVTIVEFFDYRCPYCKASASVVEHLLATDPNIRVVWRDMPILGEDSVYLAHLALAAAEQGRYREFYTAVFAKLPGHASRNQADEAIRSGGFDPQQLEAASHSGKIEAIIKRNLDLARSIQIGGTPGWIIGDQLVSGALTEDRLTQLVTEQRKRASDTGSHS